MSTSDDHDVLRAQVSAYFDGELPPADEPAVIDHLATCEECQALLGDAAGLHAAVQRGPARAAAPAPRRRGWMIGGAALVAAAAIAVVWVSVRPRRGGGGRGGEPAIALADHRAVEVRLSAGPFAAHRPYQVARGGAAGEPIPLALLAALEQRGDQRVLAAALASAGQAERARDLLAALPDEPAVLSDRAAVALLLGDARGALALADRAAGGGATEASWNRALALRELGLPLAAAGAFERVADGAWAAEAAERARALRDAEARRVAALADVDARARAMVVDGGPPLTAADVRAAGHRTRIAFYDALRTAPDRARVLALAPLADAIDAAVEPGARATLDAVAALDFGVRARFAARYRAVAAGTATPDERAALARDLAAAGPAVADLAIGVAVLTLAGDERWPTLDRLLAGARDPWFARLRTLEQALALRPREPARAEAVLRGALDACATLIDYRCARMKAVLAEVLAVRGSYVDALAWERRALADFHALGSLEFERLSLIAVADDLRLLAQLAEARGVLEDAVQRTPPGAPCVNERIVRFTLAEVARIEGDLDGARAAIPPLADCDQPAHLQAVATAVDLALQSRRPGDREVAARWLDAVRAGYPLEAEVLAARLRALDDPAGARAALAATLPRVRDGELGLAGTAYRTLARIDGGLGAWDAALAAAEAEHGLAAAPCRLVASVDDGVVTAAARGPSGAAGGEQTTTPDLAAARYAVPAAVLAPLATCPAIEVIARPPLHGRSALLPAAVPWAFVSAARPDPGPSAPRAVIVADTEPPPTDVRLPRLAPTDFPADATAITGAAATPSRVLAELSTATYAELHAHGIANLAEPGTSFLALSPERDGQWQLTAAAVAAARLAAHPVIVLGACRAASAAPRWDARWSLPDAFLAAGARAVIAADVDLPDREAAALFARLRARLAAGEAPAAAVAAERAAAIAAGQTWAAHVMVFE